MSRVVITLTDKNKGLLARDNLLSSTGIAKIIYYDYEQISSLSDLKRVNKLCNEVIKEKTYDQQNKINEQELENIFKRVMEEYENSSLS